MQILPTSGINLRLFLVSLVIASIFHFKDIAKAVSNIGSSLDLTTAIIGVIVAVISMIISAIIIMVILRILIWLLKKVGLVK